MKDEHYKKIIEKVKIFVGKIVWWISFFIYKRKTEYYDYKTRRFYM